MSYIMVDVESDGPIPGDSMVCFGAVLVDTNLDKTFYGKTKPISDKWIPEAMGQRAGAVGSGGRKQKMGAGICVRTIKSHES